MTKSPATRHPLDRYNVPRQMASLKGLQVVLELAHKRRLPSISWTIHDLGCSIVARDLRTESILHKQETFQGYLDLLMELHAKSLAKYGPGNEKYGLGTKLTVWDPARHTSDGVTRLGANLEHFTIDLGRGNKVWLLNLFVGADLDAGLDRSEDAQE